MCIICTGEIYNENLNTLQILDVAYCPDLTSEKLQEVLIQCKNLKSLDCSDCMSLTSIDLRKNINLTILWCSNCTSLTSIDLRSRSEGVTSKGCINLKELFCYNCPFLTSLDLRSNINLTRLWCHSCTSLTSLNLLSNIENIHHSRCPWIIQNKKFSSNLQRLIKIQKWYRKLLLIKYMKSQEFIEWIYNPSNIGGKCHKLKLLKEFKIEIKNMKKTN